MNIALAHSEVAQFLQCPKQAIDELWAKTELSRSLFVDFRAHEELSHSSVFDVLLYYLRSEGLGISNTEAEAWIAAVDEFTEIGDWDQHSFDDLAFMLLQIYLDFSSQTGAPDQLARQATQVLSAYFCLLSYIEPEVKTA